MARQLTARQLTARQLTARQLTARQLTARQLTARQCDILKMAALAERKEKSGKVSGILQDFVGTRYAKL